ncbi:MAG TPA: hypothetical protein VII02_09845, partial [Gemmatimonadaceae bacterium]
MKIMRNVAGLTLAGLLLSLASAHAGDAASSRRMSRPAAAKPVSIKVYKSPSCDCCKGWVQHLRDNGFKVETVDMEDLSAVKTKYGVKPA